MANSLERRVVITGIGAVCPLGRNKEEIWKRLLNGETSITDLSSTHEWVKDYDIKIGSLFQDFKPSTELGLLKKQIQRMCSFSRMSLDAAYQAVHDSGILECNPEEAKSRTGVVIGVGIGGLDEMEAQCLNRLKDGMRAVSAFAIPMVIPNAASGNIAQYFGFSGTECPSVNSSCSSGASAITIAYDKIRLGYIPIMVCGGVGDANVETIYAAYGNMNILSRNPNPDQACRPFDRLRDGLVLGDGAGVLVLEELEHARKRNAKIYGELLGYGDVLDTSNPLCPDMNGLAISRAINLALQRSRLNLDQIDYINSHGSSSKKTDTSESNGIIKAFGDRAYKIPINSTKSMIAHTSGAAAAIELIVTLLSIRDRVIHKTRNYKEKDPDCPLDYNPNQSRQLDINYALSNSIGLLGPVITICTGKYNN